MTLEPNFSFLSIVLSSFQGFSFSLYGYVLMNAVPRRPEGDARSPEAGVLGGCESPYKPNPSHLELQYSY